MMLPADPEILERYLNDHIKGFGHITRCRKFDTGQSNPTYLIETNAANYVLRTKPDGKLLRSAHQVDREFRVMSALAGSGVAVPRCFHLATQENPLGKTFFVMEHVSGRIFWDPALTELSKRERAVIYDNICKSIAKLHSLDFVSLGLGDFGAPGNYFERQVARWTKQYKASEIEPNADAHWLMDWLRDNLAQDDGQVSIIHGDYRIDNMIFSPKTADVLAILDWELSTLGHPMADVAYQCMQWRQPNSATPKGLSGVDLGLAGIPNETDYLARYCELRGISVPDNWAFYLVFSNFRMLAILTGVVRRAIDGNASNPDGIDSFRKTIPYLAHQAREIAQKGNPLA